MTDFALRAHHAPDFVPRLAEALQAFHADRQIGIIAIQQWHTDHLEGGIEQDRVEHETLGRRRDCGRQAQLRQHRAVRAAAPPQGLQGAEVFAVLDTGGMSTPIIVFDRQGLGA